MLCVWGFQDTELCTPRDRWVQEGVNQGQLGVFVSNITIYFSFLVLMFYGCTFATVVGNHFKNV